MKTNPDIKLHIRPATFKYIKIRREADHIHIFTLLKPALIIEVGVYPENRRAPVPDSGNPSVSQLSLNLPEQNEIPPAWRMRL